MKLMLLLMMIGLVASACNKEEEKEEDKEEEVTPTPDPDSKLTALPAGDQTVTGNINTGEILSDLSWAWNSSMACFVEPGKEWFEGNHVFYQIDLPEQSTIEITLDSDEDIALYAYSKGAGSMVIPPDISSCVSCEASPSNSTAIPGQKYVYLNATTNPYSIIIGVAGKANLTAGEFTMNIDVES